MKVTANVLVLAKLKKPWKDDKGTERMSYSANISQNNGEIIDTIRLSQEQYNAIEPNKPHIITADYGIGKNGAYLRITEVLPAKVTN